MVFRTAGAIATVLIGVTGQALAQYYPPPQAYPRPPVPPTVNTDELPSLNAPVVQGDLLPPVGVGPAYQAMPGARDQSGTGGYPADTGPLPPAGSPATRVFSRKTTRRLQRTLTACAASFRPTHPVRLNRMQFGKRQCDRGCGTAPVKSVRHQPVRP
jgi:hypothetical protein